MKRARRTPEEKFQSLEISGKEDSPCPHTRISPKSEVIGREIQHPERSEGQQNKSAFMWWRLLLLFIVLPLAYAGWVAAPYLGTKKKSARRMIREADVKDGEVAYDLGAGIGHFIVMAEREFGREVRGVEFVPLIWFLGILRLLWLHIPVSRLRIGDLYRQPLQGVDVIFCFLTPKAMTRLGPAFRAKCKPGARIFSYAFFIPGWEPARVVREEGEEPIFCYIV
ncbi:MAG: class I SAM-dependent methyltransferase [Patescibacteria group bacterium]